MSQHTTGHTCPQSCDSEKFLKHEQSFMLSFLSRWCRHMQTYVAWGLVTTACTITERDDGTKVGCCNTQCLEVKLIAFRCSLSDTSIVHASVCLKLSSRPDLACAMWTWWWLCIRHADCHLTLVAFAWWPWNVHEVSDNLVLDYDQYQSFEEQTFAWDGLLTMLCHLVDSNFTVCEFAVVRVGMKLESQYSVATVLSAKACDLTVLSVQDLEGFLTLRLRKKV